MFCMYRIARPKKLFTKQVRLPSASEPVSRFTGSLTDDRSQKRRASELLQWGHRIDAGGAPEVGPLAARAAPIRPFIDAAETSVADPYLRTGSGDHCGDCHFQDAARVRGYRADRNR